MKLLKYLNESERIPTFKTLREKREVEKHEYQKVPFDLWTKYECSSMEFMKGEQVYLG